MKEKIEKMIEMMTTEEMKQRLMEYMTADERLNPPPVAVEVRLNDIGNPRCRYDVLIIDEEGNETPVKFHDRYSRLIYIYTLLHPHGYQRRKSSANNYRALCQLYNLIYFKDSEALLNTIASTGFDHFLSHNIAQSRKAIRMANPLAEQFTIDHPQSHNGLLLIPFVAKGGNVIIDASLQNNISNL